MHTCLATAWQKTGDSNRDGDADEVEAGAFAEEAVVSPAEEAVASLAEAADQAWAATAEGQHQGIWHEEACGLLASTMS
jgi:hypothetical protein